MLNPLLRQRTQGFATGDHFGRYNALNAVASEISSPQIFPRDLANIERMRRGQEGLFNDEILNKTLRQEDVLRSRWVDDPDAPYGFGFDQKLEYYPETELTRQGIAFDEALNPANQRSYRGASNNYREGPTSQRVEQAKRIAHGLIAEKLRDPAFLATSAGIGAGVGLMGIGMNTMQGDSSGNLLFNPVTGSITAGTIGALVGDQIAQTGMSDSLNRRIDAIEKKRPGQGARVYERGAKNIAHASRRNRAIGAGVGAGAGALMQLMRSLGNNNQEY